MSDYPVPYVHKMRGFATFDSCVFDLYIGTADEDNHNGSETL